jgi:hypothetical protein
VPIPHGHEISGVVQADQLRSASWEQRGSRFICKAPAGVLDEANDAMRRYHTSTRELGYRVAVSRADCSRRRYRRQGRTSAPARSSGSELVTVAVACLVVSKKYNLN